MIRRKKMTLYLDIQENIEVFKLKEMIEAILKVHPVDQQLFIIFVNNAQLDESIELSDSTALLSKYGLTSESASMVHPAILGLAVRQEDNSFESLEMTPYSDSEWPQLSESTKDENVQRCIACPEKYTKMLEQLSTAKADSSKIIQE